MKFALKPILIGMAAGLVVGITLFCLVALKAFGTYESASVAQALFPYALAVDDNSSAWLILCLLFLQYPLYGALLGIAGNRVRRRMLMLVVVLLVIVGGHVAAVRAAHRAYVVWVDSQAWE